MIKNYGLLWQRKYLHIGSGGNKGTLLGKKASDLVDFREQIGIYILYDKDMSPIYVGQAGNGNAKLFARLKTHQRDHLNNRWEYFSWFGLRRVNANCTLSEIDHIDKSFKSDGQNLLDEFEGILIAAMEPRLNKQGPKFKEANQYSQAIDENIQEITLEDLQLDIKDLQHQLSVLQKQITKIS
jgi:hypothetical protein